MGFLVIDEIFDTWTMNKTDNDFHLIFNDWHEADLRAFIRRDRNHPSIIAWSYGNEVAEQTMNVTGASLSKRLKQIVYEEDPTRLSTASINAVNPEYAFGGTVDIVSLNYRGAGIRDTNPYSGLEGITTQPEYPAWHAAYPDKMILSSESASTVSTRGSYIFPVADANSAPVNDSSGGDETVMEVSDYSLYTADFGASPDKTWEALDRSPYVAGEFVWTGFDYIGEPTPYYTARSSYSGMIDTAGFFKDRAYLYQSRWRPDLPMAHILPHWNWPDRLDKITPVHVFSSGDEAELFVNGQSQGRKRKGEYEYRFRWKNILYHPGEVKVVTYKNGEEWATASRQTTGPAAGLRMTADRTTIAPDGLDLSFLTVEIVDEMGDVVPEANNTIALEVTSGPGQVVGTDNGFPGDFVPLSQSTRSAFNGMALGIVRATGAGSIRISASSVGLESAEVVLNS